MAISCGLLNIFLLYANSKAFLVRECERSMTKVKGVLNKSDISAFFHTHTGFMVATPRQTIKEGFFTLVSPFLTLPDVVVLTLSGIKNRSLYIAFIGSTKYPTYRNAHTFVKQSLRKCSLC